MFKNKIQSSHFRVIMYNVILKINKFKYVDGNWFAGEVLRADNKCTTICNDQRLIGLRINNWKTRVCVSSRLVSLPVLLFVCLSVCLSGSVAAGSCCWCYLPTKNKPDIKRSHGIRQRRAGGGLTQRRRNIKPTSTTVLEVLVASGGPQVRLFGSLHLLTMAPYKCFYCISKVSR